MRLLSFLSQDLLNNEKRQRENRSAYVMQYSFISLILIYNETELFISDGQLRRLGSHPHRRGSSRRQRNGRLRKTEMQIRRQKNYGSKKNGRLDGVHADGAPAPMGPLDADEVRNNGGADGIPGRHNNAGGAV